MKKLIGISLAVIMIVGSTPLGFSDSLRVQLDKEVEIEQLHCDNDSHVLVQRTNGSHACVTEKSAERTGWKIVSQSEKIPNPTGYWIPIPEEDREDFAKKFAVAAGTSLNGTVIDNRYLTDGGYVKVHHSANYAGWNLSVEPNERKKFTENFMDSMGFEYDNKDVKIRENLSNIWYSYSHEYSSVSFKFTKYMDETIIAFGGWTNHPELVTFPVSEKVAIQKAFEYVKNIDEIYIPESKGGGCEADIYDESDYVLKYVESGIPYYKIEVGHCNHSQLHITSVSAGVYIIIDAVTGEVTSTQYQLYN